MSKLRIPLVILCALLVAAPAADAAKKKPKPVYDFVYLQTTTTTSVSRCPIVTGGFTTVTTETIETLFQSGRVGGEMYTLGSRRLNQKQEVENSEYVRPYDLKGEPVKYDDAGKAKEVASVRKGKLTYEYPFFRTDRKLVVKLPTKVGKTAHGRAESEGNDPPETSDNGCTHTDYRKFSSGLRISRKR